MGGDDTGGGPGDEELIARLGRLASVPVPEAVAADHLRRLEAAGDGAWRLPRRAMVAALATGLVLGSSGLAAAGKLPDPAQDVAHDTLDRIGIEVPEGRDLRPHRTEAPTVPDAPSPTAPAATPPERTPTGSRPGPPPADGDRNPAPPRDPARPHGDDRPAPQPGPARPAGNEPPPQAPSGPPTPPTPPSSPAPAQPTHGPGPADGAGGPQTGGRTTPRPAPAPA